jgi:hypothetical protein
MLGKIIVVVMVSLCTGCNHRQEGTAHMPLRDINEVKEAHTSELMALPGVVGVYVGQLPDSTPCISVMVVKKTEDLVKKIPKNLEGHPVMIDETGEIKPLR